MNRKEFIRQFALVGAAAPFLSTLLSACDKEDKFFSDWNVTFNGKVLIIGAGAAGLTAGHILNKYNIDFQILEASSVHGGRMKKIEGFADFPIDLGAEWIHTDPSVLARILNDQQSNEDIDIITYNPQTFSIWKNGKLRKRNIYSNFYSEYKFKNSTWYDFFDQLIVPDIQDRIIYDTPITSIDYTNGQVLVQSLDGQIFTSDQVLVTTPISILQSDYIQFSPALPNEKVEALNSIDFPPILKVFIEFSERFYPDIVLIGGLSADDLYYDAAFGKDTERNILGLFAIGELARTYSEMSSEEEVFQTIMTELDEMFDGKASASYQKHVIQNWTHEPFIRGSYSHFQNNETETIETLIEPLAGKIYFAGEAMNLDGDTSTVHGAAESAYKILEGMLTS